ncbi:hypothetical protein DFH07DRAFT_755470 [Mycena maculata]|uniref:Zn(2)-C6 fungal-type domain-containing protein n=1 Tax=Mycena maculata TaxID=230809 RepID=A0AAD7HZW1_9AGAR|nr:hypothetical protein DFH07DRAFT_755470 [Mycena maculata]
MQTFIFQGGKLKPASPDPHQNDGLRPGQACFNCRRRKMRCDGIRPVCGPCNRGGRRDDCEYTTGGKKAKVEILETKIDRVKGRIFELEKTRRTQGSPHQLNEIASPSTSGSRKPSILRSFVDEPPRHMVVKLIDSFLNYSSEFGFFLNATRFRESALLQHPIGHHARPAPALLSAVYLLGLRLSQIPPSHLADQEPILLSRTLNFTSRGLEGNHPERIMHNLQAEILLSYFFLAAGRFVEGEYHNASAVSLSMSSSLHLIRSAPPGILSQPRDAVEEGERICAWWIATFLDQSLAVVLKHGPHLDHRRGKCPVDTPWPLEMSDYESGHSIQRGPSSNTLQNFMAGMSEVGTMSTTAMLARAALLWQHADGLARDWKPDMLQAEMIAFNNTFYNLNTLIDTFRSALVPPNGLANPTPAMARTLVVAHSMAHSAVIQLQNMWPLRLDAGAQRKRVLAAQSILGIIIAVTPRQLTYINPIMGVSLRSATWPPCLIMIFSNADSVADRMRGSRKCHPHLDEPALKSDGRGRERAQGPPCPSDGGNFNIFNDLPIYECISFPFFPAVA